MDLCPTLVDAIVHGWTRETSAHPSAWDPGQSEHGQSDVTALVVQDHEGGTLLTATLDGVQHYWNVLPDGTHADLTGTHPDTGEAIERDTLLADPAIAARYRRFMTATLRHLPGWATLT